MTAYTEDNTPMLYDGRPLLDLFMVDADNTDPSDTESILASPDHYRVPDDPIWWGSASILRDCMNIVAKAADWCGGYPERIVWVAQTPDGLHPVEDYDLFSER